MWDPPVENESCSFTSATLATLPSYIESSILTNLDQWAMTRDYGACKAFHSICTKLSTGTPWDEAWSE
jgi:hypothetical protein